MAKSVVLNQVHQMSLNCSFACPALTILYHNGSHVTCSYTSWAYGLAAALLFIGGLLPIGLFIYFCAKLKNSKVKSTLRRQESDASTFTDVSRPHDHSVYEVLRDDQNREVVFRTKKGAFPRHKYGTFSVPNLKSFGEDFASHPTDLYPDLTQVCSQDSYQTSPGSSPSPQERQLDEHVSLLSGDVVSKQQTRMQCNQCCKTNNINGLDEPRSVTFASKEKRSSSHPTYPIPKKSLGNKDIDDDNHDDDDHISNVERSISHDDNGLTMDRKNCSPIMKLSSSIPHSLESVDGIDSERRVTRSLSFQPTPPVKHLVEGIDFDLYLKDCVGKLPEDQRNGTFLIRDSQSRIGCKVLVVFYRGLDPCSLLYHYQICFTEKNEIYLYGSAKTFPSIDVMIEEFRKTKTVLPCVLSNCLGKNF